jgi:pimeloyl-ACP methyl ester carboxylesterase
LGFESFAIIGHSEGARVALLMAIKHSMNVMAVVVNGISIVNKDYAIKHINDNKNIDKWDEEYVDSLLEVYQSTDQIQDLWIKYSKFCGYYAQYFPNDFCNNQYKNIKCPLIVMHGDQV